MITTADNLALEVRSMVDNADKHMGAFLEKVRRMHGPAYRTDVSSADPLNYDFEYISLMLGKTIASNPRLKITIFGSEDERQQGRGLQQGGNRWVRSVDYRSHLHRMGVDFYLLRGISTIKLEPVPGCDPDEPLYWPTKNRIRPEDFFWDHRAQSFEDALLLGHKIRVPKDDLLAEIRCAREMSDSDEDDDGWDIAAIQELAEDSSTLNGISDGAYSPKRQEITYYEVWVKKDEPELDADDDPDDFHGVIYTLGGIGDGNVQPQFIRKPRPFFGLPTGPYCWFGCHFVPTDAAPLSALGAVEGSIQDANAQARALDENKANWKKFTVFETANKDDNVLLKNVKHGDNLALSMVDAAKFKELESGGPSEIQFLMEQHSEKRVKDVLGMYDAQRGNVSGQGTATENALADAASTARSQFQAQKFEDGVAMELRAVVFYLYRSERVVFRLDDGSLFFGGSDIECSIRVARANGLLPTHDKTGKPIPSDIGTLMDQFADAQGAPRPSKQEKKAALDERNKRLKWSQIDLQIEPYSMERTSEMTQQRRLMQGWNLLPQIMQMLMQAPYMNGKRILDMFGESLNWPDFGSLLDINAMHQYQAMQIQQAQMQAQADAQQPAQQGQGSGPAQPRPEGAGLPGNYTGAELAAANR